MVEEKEISKEIKKESSPMSKFFSKKENIWMSVSVLLAVLLIASIAVNLVGGMSKNAAGEKIVNFLNANVVEDGGVTLNSVTTKGDLYEVVVNYQGQEIPVMVTKDGQYFIQGATDMDAVANTETETKPAATEVPKTDKPKVELYVWGYCPYGVQAQGPMAEVAALLGNKVDFEIVTYYDGHGAYETQQNKIQSCIQKLYPDKYWSYAAKFVSTVYPKCSSARTEECDKTESIAVMKTLGIDSAKVMSCVASDGAGLIAEASGKAQAKGVTGSPTITINGVIVNAARTSEAIKTAICSAFNTAPSECAEVMSATAAASSGSC